MTPKPWYPMDVLSFDVVGRPVPKQSFRVVGKGGYRDPRVTAWQDLVAAAAVLAMQGRAVMTGKLIAELSFYIPERRKGDLDNLSKGVLDALNGLVWGDDGQVVRLVAQRFAKEDWEGVSVRIGLL